jgi:hypothetical protein
MKSLKDKIKLGKIGDKLERDFCNCNPAGYWNFRVIVRPQQRLYMPMFRVRDRIRSLVI